MSVLLDTHVWIWWLTPRSALSQKEIDALDRLARAGDLAIASISLWEVQMLQAKQRLQLPTSLAEWLGMAADARVVRILPLDVDAVLALDALPESFHGDPADRVIVATARAHGLSLATHDAAIRRSRVISLWKP